MNISPSLMSRLLDKDVCPKSIYYEYVERRTGRQSEAMIKGQLFEYLLLGTPNRDGTIPVLEKGKNGNKLKPETDLEECVALAREVLRSMGLNIDGEKQVRLLHKDGGIHLSGYIDLLTNNIDGSGLAIYDLKYTETKYDDRWNGWADFESMVDQQRQARHYIYVYYLMYGVWLPYYFLVFGKSGWVRVLKCLVTDGTIFGLHKKEVEFCNELLIERNKSGWAATPEFNKCMDCPHFEYCDSKHVKPVPQVFTI